MNSNNDLSAAVIDLFAVYHPALPADLGRLDVLERQVVLDVIANDLTAQAAALSAGDAAALTAEAGNGLELADALERLY
jgi:hypothetical protein